MACSVDFVFIADSTFLFAMKRVTPLLDGGSVIDNDWVQKLEKITPATVADYCQVSKCTVLNWIKNGQLTAFRLPSGHYRITRIDFMAFLKEFNIPIQR